VAGRIKKDVCLLCGVTDQSGTNLLKLIAATNSYELHLPISPLYVLGSYYFDI